MRAFRHVAHNPGCGDRSVVLAIDRLSLAPTHERQQQLYKARAASRQETRPDANETKDSKNELMDHQFIKQIETWGSGGRMLDIHYVGRWQSASDQGYGDRVVRKSLGVRYGR